MSEKKAKSKSIATDDDYNYVNVRVDKSFKPLLKQLARQQRRSVPICGGMLLEQALSALSIEQKPNLTIA